MKSYTYLEGRKAMKKIKAILEKMMNSFIIVEGKKDVESLKEMGLKAHTILEMNKAKGDVMILTDNDREGDRLAKMIYDELLPNPNVNTIDTNSRKILCSILNIKTFESFGRKIKEFENEIMEVI